MGTETIETQRLLLRRFIKSDGEQMFLNWANDKEVTKYLTWPHYSDKLQAVQFIYRCLEQYDNEDYFNWAIELKDDPNIIGNISVVNEDKINKVAEIGYCLGRSWWGNGYMPEALQAVIKYLANCGQFNKLIAYHDTRNPNSGKVMLKAGMSFNGILKNAGKNNQGVCDEAYYSINV